MLEKLVGNQHYDADFLNIAQVRYLVCFLVTWRPKEMIL
jgi:hypothetical protein